MVKNQFAARSVALMRLICTVKLWEARLPAAAARRASQRASADRSKREHKGAEWNLLKPSRRANEENGWLQFSASASAAYQRAPGKELRLVPDFGLPSSGQSAIRQCCT